MRVRTRYAPSPTGSLHLGGLRTALYNYLFAKKHGGDFLLRIEDTDQTRLVPGAADSLADTLLWAGVKWNEGFRSAQKPEIGSYVQSERLPTYRHWCDHLLTHGHAYPCFCSTERLEAVRKQQSSKNLSTSYDRNCRTLSVTEAAKRVATGESHVIRFKVPLQGETVVDDIIRGKVSFSHLIIDDQVLIKSDQYPTYHLAAVVDDHLMEISHVIRGEEWLSSTPKHMLLYKAFGWDHPKFAHLPLLLREDGGKLSKRHGSASVEEYNKNGYLPEALVNFVASLGWSSTDTDEVFTMQQLIERFELERVQKGGAKVAMAKLDWLNGIHMRQRLASHDSTQALVQLAREQLSKDERFKAVLKDISDSQLEKVLRVMKDRIQLISQLLNHLYFFEDPIYDSPSSQAVMQKMWKPESDFILKALLTRLHSLSTDDFTVGTLQPLLASFNKELNVSARDLLSPLRFALSGHDVGAPVSDTMEILGKEKCIQRIENALKHCAIQFIK